MFLNTIKLIFCFIWQKTRILCYTF